MIPDRFTTMSVLGRRIMELKLDRALAAAARDIPRTPQMWAYWEGVVMGSTLQINALARTAAKNW